MKSFNLIIKKDWISSVISTIIVLNIIASSNGDSEEPPAFFLKIAKTIPRIGRSQPYEDYFEKNSHDMNEDPWYKDAEYPNHKIYKRAYEFSPEGDTRTWQHFPLSIEGPPELWKTLAGYSNDPLYSSTNDFNNRLWSRDKRTNSRHIQP